MIVNEHILAEYFPDPLSMFIAFLGDVFSRYMAIEGLLRWQLRLVESLKTVHMLIRVDSLVLKQFQICAGDPFTPHNL